MKYLIVIDMQKDFVTGALGTKEAQAILPNVIARIEAAKAAGETVLYTLDTHETDYMNTAEGRKLPVPHCIKGTDGWQLDAKVQAALANKAYRVIEKPTFGSTELPEYIKVNYSNTEVEFELIGLCTDICVVSNALMLKANFIESKVSVDASCCAGVTVESHNAALTTMKMCQVNVIGG